jgi:hypothetical protein
VARVADEANEECEERQKPSSVTTPEGSAQPSALRELLEDAGDHLRATRRKSGVQGVAVVKAPKEPVVGRELSL